MERPVDRLYDCEKILRDKIRELPADDSRINTYHTTIEHYFRSLDDARQKRLLQGASWTGINAEAVTESLRELWVMRARPKLS